MSVTDLDELLNDLERTIEQQSGEGNSLHVLQSSRHVAAAVPTTRSPPHLLNENSGGSCQRTPGHSQPPSLRCDRQSSPSARCADSSMSDPAATVGSPVRQNMNELDVLLQDLSNARFSERVEKKSEMISTSQTFTETSTISKMIFPNDLVTSNGFPNDGRTASKKSQSSEQRVEDLSSTGTGIHGSLIPGQRTSLVKTPPTLPDKYFSASSSQQRRISSTAITSIDGFPASSATRELDDLMTSLNTFNIKEGPMEEPVLTTLDDMLGDLQEDMDKQGIRTTQKGVCHACEKPIIGQVITALAKTFHPEHFVCTKCNQELGTRNFFERDGKPYCELDYHAMFSPRCAACDGPILDKCVSALDRTWHPEHFVCAGSDCQQPFGDDGYHEREDKAYCRDCYYSSFAPKCGGCSFPITENYISSLDRPWHPGCFVCRQCGQPFADGNFFEHNNQPFCEVHYHEMRGSPCAGCGKPISGRCITAMFRKFHPEHFVCSFCLKQLNKGTFKENGDKPYCHGCYERLFG